jgi:hypothetical protein
VPSVPDDLSEKGVDALFDELESLGSEDFADLGEEPEKKKKKETSANNQFAQKLIKLGYFQILAIGETFAAPHLNGLVRDAMGDKTIDECLTELADLYEDSLGLSDLDPHYKLLLATAMLGANAATANSMKQRREVAASSAVTVESQPPVALAEAGVMDSKSHWMIES